MNREEILALSNEEINRLIAEKWMGWKVEGNVIWFPDGDFSYLVPDLGGYYCPYHNLTDAMEALEKFKNKVVVTIKLIGDRYDITLIGYKEAAVLREKSLPKAICQCILLYLNEKEHEERMGK